MTLTDEYHTAGLSAAAYRWQDLSGICPCIFHGWRQDRGCTRAPRGVGSGQKDSWQCMGLMLHPGWRWQWGQPGWGILGSRRSAAPYPSSPRMCQECIKFTDKNLLTQWREPDSSPECKINLSSCLLKAEAELISSRQADWLPLLC